MLISEPINWLQANSEELPQWGRHLYQSFLASKLENPKVVWINERWFLESGIDVTDIDTRAVVETWLLDQFAYVALSSGQRLPEAGSKKVFYADRYGATGLVVHGGSGRAGITGRFQVKGIGATPLIGVGADWYHSHGCMWLEEAIREAIFGEIYAAEFPGSAIPTIAIVDTGLNHRSEDGFVGERRSLAVRPFVIRPAHLQRAPLFKPVVEDILAQYKDAQRVKEIVHHLQNKKADDSEQGIGYLRHLFQVLGEQAAFSQVHRLMHGGFYSSNMAINGALLDFGSASALRAWQKHKTSATGAAFGDEGENVRQIAESLCFYVRKYGGESNQINPDELMLTYQTSHAQRWEIEWLRVFNLHRSRSPERAIILDRLTRFYVEQQSCSKAPLSENSGSTDDSLRKILDDLLSEIERTGLSDRDLSAVTAARFLCARRNLDRQSLQSQIFSRLLHRNPEVVPDPKEVSNTINENVSLGRRHWPNLPDNLAVHAQVFDSGTSALLCTQYPAKGLVLWIEGTRFAGRVRIFNQWIHEQNLTPADDTATHTWTGIVPIGELPPIGFEINIGGCMIEIPPFSLTY